MENSKRIQRRNKRNQTQVIDYKSLLQTSKKAVEDAKKDVKAIEDQKEMMSDETESINIRVDIPATQIQGNALVEDSSLAVEETLTDNVANNIETQASEIVENPSERQFEFSKTLDFFKNLEKANRKKQQSVNKPHTTLIKDTKEKNADVTIADSVDIDGAVREQKSVNSSRTSVVEDTEERCSNLTIADIPIKDHKMSTVSIEDTEDRVPDLIVITGGEDQISVTETNTTQEIILHSAPNNILENTENYTNPSQSSNIVVELNSNNSVLSEGRMFAFNDILNMWKSKVKK
ncbi:hypothetical protein NGRA_3442 [Nosema granulosis]|uniref:Uncharacterized protein n=1 Tax=Nosema granulosis TaxID=83296 RepID=A0A9P6GVT2_9MICR|nr:hypothetical protein NGRA_3442 [Nosema granulosis]